MRKTTKKLALNRETVRSLQDAELVQVVGGRREMPRLKAQLHTGGGCTNCVCASTSTTVTHDQVVE